MPFIYTSPELKFPATQQVGPASWILELPYWHVDPVTGEVTFIPPSGLGQPEDIVKSPVYVTDYRSGPAIVDVLIEKQGAHSAAWLKHDYGYASERKPRRQLDVELYRDLKETGANFAQREAVYVGVRLGGGAVWRQHDPVQVQRLRDWAQYCRPLFELPAARIQEALNPNHQPITP